MIDANGYCNKSRCKNKTKFKTNHTKKRCCVCLIYRHFFFKLAIKMFSIQNKRVFFCGRKNSRRLSDDNDGGLNGTVYYIAED